MNPFPEREGYFQLGDVIIDLMGAEVQDENPIRIVAIVAYKPSE